MWVALGFFNGDLGLTRNLLNWIGQLDGKVSHGLLLVTDPSTSWSDAVDLVNVSSGIFQRVEIITADEEVIGWPAGANFLFKAAALWFQGRKIAPWLWLEPDAVPLKKGWLDALQAAYFSAGKPFFGSIMEATEAWMPSKYLPGISIYPHDCWNRIIKTWDESKAFDVATASATVPLAANTKLLQHFWGQKNLPPVFSFTKTSESPVNTLTLESINPEAVVFHRVKNDSLLKLLGYKEIFQSSIKLVVCFPFCWMDSKLMLSQLQWLHRLNGKIDRTAVLHFDNTVDNSTLTHIKTIAGMTFKQVLLSHYRSSPRTGWPAACNWAFQHAARFMAKIGSSWLWCEADCVAVQRDWLEQLEFEYEKGGKPFGGTIVGAWDGLQGGHANGVAIYPGMVSQYSRAVMATVTQAWDTAMHDELGKEGLTAVCHKMNHLIQHCGAVVDGKCKPANGPIPSFGSQRDVDTIVERSTVLFHPAKDTSLISRLTERL